MKDRNKIQSSMSGFGGGLIRDGIFLEVLLDIREQLVALNKALSSSKLEIPKPIASEK
jgi:hypothetical protein